LRTKSLLNHSSQPPIGHLSISSSATDLAIIQPRPGMMSVR
jgi:hypothetical protein